MRKLALIFLTSLLYCGCIVVPAEDDGYYVVYADPIVEPVYQCEFAYPIPYHSAPDYCDSTCCTWVFEGYGPSFCEETWCNYDDGCGWEFDYEICIY